MTTRRFYKQTYQVTVLSERQHPELNLEEIRHNILEGDDVGETTFVGEEELDGAGAVVELYRLGSEPGFFQLDDAGNDCES